MEISKDHPRYRSLVTRETMAEMVGRGIVSPSGLIAHGRGEAFDYILGEKTTDAARSAEIVGTALLLSAKRPVISVNGNTAALCSKEIVELADLTDSKIEVNLFHHTQKRIELVVSFMEAAGGKGVLGRNQDAKMPGIASDRALCEREGVFSADVVLVPLEDGDRAEALVRAGKKVIVVDLNPLSRSARAASITVVDEVTRAIPNMSNSAPDLRNEPKRRKVLAAFDNAANLAATLKLMAARLEGIAAEGKG
ncbi:MAG: 4-phosphopantoate--beta-alanine ligase [Methanomassiliicoccales archaeon]